jgi:uroporphyrinogen decarboxylase
MVKKRTPMNSRERILSAINHRQPDRVPIDLGGTRQSGIAVSTYCRLKEHLGIKSPSRIFDLYQMLAEVERPILERFGADVIGLYRKEVTFEIANEKWKPWKLFDGTAVEVPGGFQPVEENGDLLLTRDGAPIARMPKDGYYFDRLETYPGAAHEDPKKIKLPILSSLELEHYHQKAEALYQNTDFAIVAPLGPAYELFFGLGTGDFSSWMLTFASEPDYVDELYERILEAWLTNLKLFSEAVGDRVQILQVCDDLGTQASQFISTKMFRQRVFPYYKRAFDWIHQNTKLKVMLHSDGAIMDLIPSLIEMGVDILNPVQTTAKGMDPKLLKESFGSQIVFWGGSCDCQDTLSFGTAEQVAREAECHLKTFAPGGGYVFASVHNIQAQVPSENIVRLFDSALRFKI